MNKFLVSVSKARLLIKQLTKQNKAAMNQVSRFLEEQESILLTDFSIGEGLVNLFDKKTKIYEQKEQMEKIGQAILELRVAVSIINQRSGADVLLAEIANLHQSPEIQIDTAIKTFSRLKVHTHESYQDLTKLKDILLDKKASLRENDPNKVTVSLLTNRSITEDIRQMAENTLKKISMKENELALLNSETKIDLTEFVSKDSLEIISELL